MDIELLTTKEMAAADRATIAAGTPGITLMEAAGAAVARSVARWAAAGRRHRIAIACGPGNNGGDGFVAARLLKERGFDVSLALLGAQSALKGDAAEAARRFGGPVSDLAALRFEEADAIIDALFGAGLARDLDGEARAAVERMNASGRPVVAVDIPSGIDGDTGAVRGAAVAAVETVTFFRLKPGHVLLPGRIHCGRTDLADIGIARSVLEAIRPAAFINLPRLWRNHLPRRRAQAHKYSYGHAVVVSGGLTHTGAARLVARGALRAGAGLVTVASPGDALSAHAAHLTAIMLMRCDEPAELSRILADRRKNAVALGPAVGVGERTRRLVEAAAGARQSAGVDGRAFVLDADALASFAGDAGALAQVVGRAEGPVVMTPHDGEFAKMFAAEPDVLSQPSKLERTRAAARRLGAIVLLKGADTVIAAPDGRAAIAVDLPPFLATAGSGDVLAGIICGLLAQRMPGFEAACCGAWMHGAAATAFGAGLIAEDIPEALPSVWRNLLDPAGDLFPVSPSQS